MSDPQTPPKDDSFFRKVVRFVANPATDWADLNSRQDEGRDLDLEKSELKAMIERKKRNDFVRKREFDMLRKVRREGLSPEQLAALGGSSRLDDSESKVGNQITLPKPPLTFVIHSTAAGFTPPTVRSSEIPPKTSMPGTTWRTMKASEAVGS